MAYPEQVSYDTFLRVAGEVLENTGDLSIQALARRLGVRPQSLYRHATSLAELKNRVATNGYLRLGLALQKAADADGSWLALATAYRSFAAHHPHLYRLMTGPHGRARRDTDAQMATLAPLSRMLGAPSDSRRFLIRHFMAWAFIHGFVSLELEHQFLTPDGVEDAFQHGVAMVARAVGTIRHRRRS